MNEYPLFVPYAQPGIDLAELRLCTSVGIDLWVGLPDEQQARVAWRDFQPLRASFRLPRARRRRRAGRRRAGCPSSARARPRALDGV